MTFAMRYLLMCCVISLCVGAMTAQPAPGPELRASHILIRAERDDRDQAIKKLAVIRKWIEDEVAQAHANLPESAAKAEREKARVAALKKAFAEAARKHSDCPSKQQGGDIGWFPRHDVVVEPFAKVAFAVTPVQMAGPVLTEFGYHLILVTERK